MTPRSPQAHPGEPAYRADTPLSRGARYYAPRAVALRVLGGNLAVRTGDPAWLAVSVDLLECYLPTGWRTMSLWEVTESLHRDSVTPGLCTFADGMDPTVAPAEGDTFVASDTSDYAFEPGHTYTVVATYTDQHGIGRMDLVCEALDTAIGGVRWDDPALQRNGHTPESLACVARLYAHAEQHPDD